MRIAMASDHAGHQLKDWLRDKLAADGHLVTDLGGTAERCDYPQMAEAVGRAVSAKESELGVLVCGSGIGVSIAANKVAGIRAALVSEPVSARLAREHNDANVLCLGERLIGKDMAWECVLAFLAGAHAGGRHAERVKQIHQIERRHSSGPVPQ